MSRSTRLKGTRSNDVLQTYQATTLLVATIKPANRIDANPGLMEQQVSLNLGRREKHH